MRICSFGKQILPAILFIGNEKKSCFFHIEPVDVRLAQELERVNIAQFIVSGRVLDSRPKGRGFEPHWRHCVVSLSKAH